MRKKEISKQLQEGDEAKQQEKEEVQIEEDPNVRLIRRFDQLKPLDPIPEIEWWDTQLLLENHKSFKGAHFAGSQDIKSLSQQLDIKDFEVTENEFNDKKITHYVHHPIPLKNPLSEAVKGKINVLLTDKERKRLKKLRKAEKVKEKHEKIHLGLIPAPAPRLKMSSFMRAVTAQAVADPSKVEKEVRRQEIERQKAHIEHNEKRRLTKAQRHDKFKSKMDRDTKKETWSALFRIKSLKDPKNFFKVDKNAQQLYLHGMCIYTDKLKEDQGVHFHNLVVVEGGKVAVRKYKKLLMRRIKWNNKEEHKQESSEEDEDDTNDKKNALQNTEECTLVWEGTIQKKFFDKWRVVEAKSEHEAVRALADRG